MAVAGTIAVLFFVLFMALGTWQVHRRAWKLDLIARVEQRVHAPATPAPGPAQWPKITAASDEYRHVTATGTFLDASQTLVQAVTDFGAGFWVLTPLQAVDGSVVLVNRGFIPADDRGRVQPAGAASSSTVTGLLRMTEPGGAFLRHNNPGGNQWYSRDVQAIAAARGLTHVAPYFIDAEGPPHGADGGTRGADTGLHGADGGTRGADTGPHGADTGPHGADGGADGAVRPPPGEAARPTLAEAHQPPASAGAGGPTGVLPIPGLTVIHFHNSHLVYAITWYTLALMVAIAITQALRKP